MFARVTPLRIAIVVIALVVGTVSLFALTQADVLPDPAPETASADVLRDVPDTYAPEKVSFAVQFGDEVIPYRVFGVYVLPNETVQIETLLTQSEDSNELTAGGGAVKKSAAGRWMWTAPADPGYVEISVRSGEETVHLNVFVMVPFDNVADRIDNFSIGRYEATPLRDNPAYTRPDGFIKVTDSLADVLVSPHLKLGQFTSKQSTDFPKYLRLQARLLLKLEWLLEQLNERGIAARSLHIMSGFRTPYYNASIGNTTTYSVHLYGGAADIYVDDDGDDFMDDLNGDGTVDREDAVFLANIIEESKGETWYAPFKGGMGIYDTTPDHGPFVHVDVRGQEARW